MSHWTLLGCGAVGGVLTGLLMRAGQQVSLLHTRAGGPGTALVFEDRQGQRLTFAPERLQVQDASRIRRLLVTTKAYQVAAALTPLIGRLPAEVPILLLHNGMGTESWVREHFPAHPLLLGITSNGALRPGPTHFRHTGPGETWLGAANPAGEACRGLASELAAALPHAGWSDDIRARQWTKLVINAVINPLTALEDVPNGALLAEPQRVRALCAELLPLLERQGLTQPLDYWVQNVLTVARLTAGNASSMREDLRHHRQTEIDYMNGFLLREAARLGVALPRHQALYQAIKAKESA